jgi:hypothetical protein
VQRLRLVVGTTSVVTAGLIHGAHQMCVCMRRSMMVALLHGPSRYLVHNALLRIAALHVHAACST